MSSFLLWKVKQKFPYYCFMSEPNFLHLENGTSICGSNPTAPWRRRWGADCNLFIRTFPVGKKNEPDLQVSTWVILKSIMLPNRRQTARREFTDILLCKFCKHTKQNWIMFVDIYICRKSKKCMRVLNTKEKIVSFLKQERWRWSYKQIDLLVYE